MTISATYHQSGIEIEGSAEALQELADKMQSCTGTDRISLLNSMAKDERGLPYANALVIHSGQGLVKITASDGEIFISGSHEKLLMLAKNILFLAESPVPETPSRVRDHIHAEYFPGDFPLLDETASPLIVTRQEIEEVKEA
jgi:hypothetical protein